MKLLSKLLIAGGVLYAVKGLDDRLEITHYTICSPRLPESFNNFRIAQISDYHCDNIPGLESEIRGESPDIIVCTGDMADDKGSYTPAVHLIEKLSDIAPIYMVSGNHDLWRNDCSSFFKDCESVGGKYLHDERIFLTRGNDKIAISGIIDPLVRDKDKIKQSVEKSLSKLPEYDGYEILLFHRANMLDLFASYKFDIILSGHMHGGQFRIPKSQSGICAPRSSILGNEPIFFPKYTGGLYKSGDTTMIVNRGLGNPMIIPRLFNRPEITIITLNHTVPTKQL